MGKSTFFTAVTALAVGASAQIFSGNSSSSATGTGMTVIPTSSAITTSASNGTVIPSATMSSNGTTVASTTSSTTAGPVASDPVYCPALAGQTTSGPLGVTYAISCDTNYGGVLININVNNKVKRQSPGTSLQDCLTVCSALSNCVASAFDTNNPECYYYSSLGGAFQANGFEFATVASRDGMTNSTALPNNGTASATGTGVMSSSAPATDAPYPTGNNGTAAAGPTGTTTSAAGTPPSTVAPTTTASPDDYFCPNLNGEIFINGLDISFIIECGQNHFGVIIDITLAKRQAAAGATSLNDCLTLCSNNAACVGTAFNTVEGTCTLFSSIGAAYADPDVEFAIVAPAAAVGTPGQTLTVPVFSTRTITVQSCAPTVTNCAVGAVVYQTIAVSSTVYVCPSYTTYPAVPVACTSCPYAAVTATAYSTTTVVIKSCAPTVTNCPYNSNGVLTAGNNGGAATTYPAGATLTNGGITTVLASASTGGGSGSGSTTDVTKITVTPVATTVVNYPAPTSTGGAATASVVTTVAAGTKTGSSASATSSGLMVFNGAATQLGAGSAAGALIAAVAFML